MRIGRFLGRAEADRDQLQQIESYIEIETDENIARGMPAEEARAMARRKFGNSALIREEIYRMNTIFLFERLPVMSVMVGAHCGASRSLR